jgi:hypothetical protein
MVLIWLFENHPWNRIMQSSKTMIAARTVLNLMLFMVASVARKEGGGCVNKYAYLGYADSSGRSR